MKRITSTVVASVNMKPNTLIILEDTLSHSMKDCFINVLNVFTKQRISITLKFMLTEHEVLFHYCDQCDYAEKEGRLMKKHIAVIHEGKT
jgi:hypothetical protein